MSTFYVPAVNLIGKGVVKEVGSYVKELGYSRGFSNPVHLPPT